MVFHHLMKKDFPEHYVTWVMHEKINMLPNPIELLINEAFRGLRHKDVDAGPSQVAGEEETLHDLSDSNNKDYFELLKNGSEDLYEEFKAVLFKFQWADTTQNRGFKIDAWKFNCVNFSKLIHIGDRMDDDPYIEASQANLVYYVDDENDKEWSVAGKVVAVSKKKVEFGGDKCDEEDTSHSGPTICPESQPSQSVYLTSHPSPIGWDSSQSSQSVHSTSHMGLANHDSTHVSSIDLAPINKRLSGIAKNPKAYRDKSRKKKSWNGTSLGAWNSSPSSSPNWFSSEGIIRVELEKRITYEGGLIVVDGLSDDGAIGGNSVAAVGANDAPRIVFKINHYQYDHTGYTDFASPSECFVCKCQDYRAKHDVAINAINALTAFVKELTSNRGVIPSKRILYPFTPLEIKAKRIIKVISKALSSIQKSKIATPLFVCCTE
ncbi:hypothetical protein BC332_18716 [Capsicum chinense]|nr:hypothetical protein BC332_18716 [Capsicum chinense]